MNTLIKWNEDKHFHTSVYSASRSEFLSSVKPVFEEYINTARKDKNAEDVYPSIMTTVMNLDPRLEVFSKYIADVSWDVLDSQGYNVDSYYTYIQSMWGQSHPKTSNMEQHTHGENSQLVGFYFIDVPEDSSQVFFYDPRVVKTHAGLSIKKSDTLSSAHDSVYYVPKPGDLYITNSWLAHSFTRNKSVKPFNFLHINIGVISTDYIETKSYPVVV